MPLIESQPDALTHIYARSLFELAEAEGGQDATERVLSELEDVLELARADGKFNEFLASRLLAADKRDASLRTIFEGKVSPLTLRFLRLLNAKDRLGYLPPIVGAYDSLVQEHFGRIEVDVYTAGPISRDELARIKDQLQQRLGKDVIAHPYTDSTMIGGIRLRIGDRLIDSSVSTRLRRLREQLGERGAANIRARATRIIEGELDVERNHDGTA